MTADEELRRALKQVLDRHDPEGDALLRDVQAALAALSEPRAGHNDDECPYRELALAAIREDLAATPLGDGPPVVEESELDGDPMALAWDATPPAEGLDVERLARALWKTRPMFYPAAWPNDDPDDIGPSPEEDAANIAREYAALAPEQPE